MTLKWQPLRSQVKIQSRPQSLRSSTGGPHMLWGRDWWKSKIWAPFHVWSWERGWYQSPYSPTQSSSFTILVSWITRIPEKLNFLLLKALQGIIYPTKKDPSQFEGNCTQSKEFLPPESKEFVATGTSPGPSFGAKVVAFSFSQSTLHRLV